MAWEDLTLSEEREGTYEGNVSGSESWEPGTSRRSESSLLTRAGVLFVGDELGKGRGDEVPAVGHNQAGMVTGKQPHGLTRK